MKHLRLWMVAILFSAVCLPAAQASTSHHKRTSSHASKTSRRSRKSGKTHKAAHVVRGQQVIDSARATQIQQALVREHYISGAPTGVWDDQSRDAMARYQAANGWQTKVIPDSRALIKLGLGPEAGVAPPVTSASASSAATAPPPAIRASANPTSAPPSASGHSATLGSAITAHNNTQNIVLPE